MKFPSTETFTTPGSRSTASRLNDSRVEAIVGGRITRAKSIPGSSKS
jgi:hypothetical protein